MFVCARCTRTDQTRMRNSALCQGCWRALADAGLRWCPRCREARPLFRRGGYCPDCQRAFDRERNADPRYRAAARARNARWMARQKEARTMTTDRCQQCTKPLTPQQVHNQNQTCSPACARAWKKAQPKPCDQCGRPVPTRTKGRRFCDQACAKAYRRHDPKPHTAPTPSPVAPVAPEPAQQATGAPGDVLGREGQTVYTVGQLNTRLYVYDDRGVYCPLAQWPQSTAARRLAKQGERSVFDEVPATPSAWRRHYPVQEEL